MNFCVLLLAAFAALAAGTGAGETDMSASTPLDDAMLNRELVDQYKNSFAVVRYYTKKNEKGDEPDFGVPYKCPNCGETHYRRGGESSENGIPAEFVGFVIAPDRILMRDLMIDPSFVERIEVECAGERIPASEFEASPERDALVLKTDRPFADARPLNFKGGDAPSNPLYFFIAREDGETVAGFSSSKVSDFRHHVELGVDLYEGNPNTLVIDEDGDAVTISLGEVMELGAETFLPPSKWEMEPASRRFEALASKEARLRRAVFPVYLQLEAKGKEGGRLLLRFSGGDDAKNDIDAVGVLLEGGRVAVVASLSAADTARLVKIEATLPDGTKSQLDFVGSYVEAGGFEARFNGAVPEGLEPFAVDRREALDLWDEKFALFEVFNNGGVLDVNRTLAKVDKFERERGNRTVASFRPVASARSSDRGNGGAGVLVSAGGKLTVLDVESRRGRWSRGHFDIQGARLAELVDGPRFDMENVPRKADDRRRTPWLGVEVQSASPDVIREKKATSYLKDYVERAPLVTGVAPGTPAEQLGIKTGDILLGVKFPGSSRTDSFSLERDVLAEINWEDAFEDEQFIEFGSSGEITPWPDVEGGINETLAKYGVGAEVVVSWVSDGVRREGKTTLVLAPVHYKNAPRARNKDLGMTVCDMTYEVRKYFKLDDDAPGVVVSKVKGGGVAAVAGIRPLELVIDVNGEGVKSAKDFQEKTKGKKDLNFTVRRLTATRVVPIRL